MEISVVFSFSEVLPEMASWARGYETSQNLYQEPDTCKLWQQITGFSRIFLGRQLHQRAKMFRHFKDLLSPFSWCCKWLQDI